MKWNDEDRGGNGDGGVQVKRDLKTGGISIKRLGLSNERKSGSVEGLEPTGFPKPPVARSDRARNEDNITDLNWTWEQTGVSHILGMDGRGQETHRAIVDRMDLNLSLLTTNDMKIHQLTYE